MNLKEILTAYEPYNEQETIDVNKILTYLETEQHLFTRENTKVHFSSSPWIINQDNTKVLMVHHNIYNSWGWCGGHTDGDEDFLHVALKEGMEETGLTNLQPYLNELFAIDILPVPEHMKNGKIVKAHDHVNFTYLCIADEQEQLKICPNENSGVMWILKDAINTYVNEEDMKPVYQKLKEKADKLYKAKSIGQHKNVSPFK